MTCEHIATMPIKLHVDFDPPSTTATRQSKLAKVSVRATLAFRE